MLKMFYCMTFAVLLNLGGCAINKKGEVATNRDRGILMQLNEALTRSQLIDRDPTFISKTGIENMRVLAPGGLIEGKSQVVKGLSGWDVKDVELTGTEIVFHRNIAIVSGRMDIDGTMQPVGRWGPLKYMSTWIKEDGEWRLVSRSLTPCLKKLIELGRC